jgi:hypothetical protein
MRRQRGPSVSWQLGSHLFVLVVAVEPQADAAEGQLLDKGLADLVPRRVVTASPDGSECGPVAVVEQDLEPAALLHRARDDLNDEQSGGRCQEILARHLDAQGDVLVGRDLLAINGGCHGRCSGAVDSERASLLALERDAALEVDGRAELDVVEERALDDILAVEAEAVLLCLGACRCKRRALVVGRHREFVDVQLDAPEAAVLCEGPSEAKTVSVLRAREGGRGRMATDW